MTKDNMNILNKLLKINKGNIIFSGDSDIELYIQYIEYEKKKNNEYIFQTTTK